MLCYLRGQRIQTEAEIAWKADFGSAEAMHHQLKAWGFMGLVPPERDEQTPKAKVPAADNERKARQGGGEAEELPAAADAKDIFEVAIERLKTDLHYTNHLNEVLQDGRFEATFFHPKEEEMLPDVYLREEVSPERWEELCAEHGEDPVSTDALFVPVDRRYVGGASPWPSMHLVRLIAAYLVCARTWHDVDLLLERLHPKSREPNRAQLNKYLTGNDGLLPIIKRLASVVRGKTIKRSLNAEPMDLAEHTVGDFMRRRREQGIPEEEIMREAREELKVPEDEISRLEKIFSPRSSKE